MRQTLFDSILDSKVSVWKKGAGQVDQYGIESQVFQMLVADLPCSMQEGSGKELETEAAYGVQTFTFYLRPVFVDSPPVPLNIHHWFQVNFQYGVPLADPDPNGKMYDIKNIKNHFGHHLEVEAQLIEP